MNVKKIVGIGLFICMAFSMGMPLLAQQKESTKDRLMKLMGQPASPKEVRQKTTPKVKSAPAIKVKVAAAVPTAVKVPEPAVKAVTPAVVPEEKNSSSWVTPLIWTILGLTSLVVAFKKRDSLMLFLRRALHYKQWSLSARIGVLSLLVIVGIGILALTFLLPVMEKMMIAEKQTSLRNVVQIAHSLVTEYKTRVEKGEFDLAEGQKRALARINNLRYNTKEYFWINDLHAVVLANPKRPDLVGSNQDSFMSGGKYVFREFIAAVKDSGNGYVAYDQELPGLKRALPKLSYVKLYEPWGWIIGSGIYIDDVDKQISDFRLNTIIALSVLAMCIIGVSIVVARSITRPIKIVAHQMDNADINTTMNIDEQNEIGDLARSFDQFTERIRTTIFRLSEMSATIASASTQISSSTEEMTAGSQEQASHATEVAGAVEEMTKTILENSNTAAQTASTAQQARQAAEEGMRVVSETVQGMKRIAEVVNSSAQTVHELGKSSDQIGEIITVIDDIADQTNLLALNAAIEAARAGEQGRGFAVVADEVRKLAERTTKATKEIAGMIKKIQTETVGAVQSMEQGTKEVEAGIELADRAGDSLNKIVGVAQQVTDMVNQIAVATKQQSAASEQISKNVEAISSVTTETGKGIQQIAVSTEDLSRLTENLRMLVEEFHLTEAEGHSPIHSSSENRTTHEAQRSIDGKRHSNTASGMRKKTTV
jgi:methyl-accepting chemotaxis protein